jgi:hypothetical protein
LFIDPQTLLPELSRLPEISSKVSLWDAISIWSLIALVVFEVAGMSLGKYRRIHVACERLAVISLALLAFADREVHVYRGIQDGLLTKKQAAYDQLVSDQSETISRLTGQVKTAMTTASTAQANNVDLLAIAKQQSRDIDRLRNKQDGPFTWNMSFTLSSFHAQPNSPFPVPFLGSFTPDRDITVTRVVAPSIGPSFVSTTNGRSEPCSVPPYFFLFSGPPFSTNPRYRLSLPNGNIPSFAVDSGPISVDFPAGVLITASYQAGFDATQVCFNVTNMNGVDPNGDGSVSSNSPLIPDNFTVQYVAREKRSEGSPATK